MNRSVILSISMAVIATIWVLSGSFSESEDSKTAEQLSSEQTEGSAPAFKVKVQKHAAQKKQEPTFLQGGIAAARPREVRAENQVNSEKILITRE